MVLSKREHVVLLIAVMMVSLLLMDRFIINPVMIKFEQTKKKRSTLASEVEAMDQLLEHRHILEERWQTMSNNGLTEEPSDAESHMFHALETWASQCSVTLPSVTPQWSITDQGLRQIVFTVAGKGDIKGIGEFLWSIEQADLPVRINSLQLGSTNTSGQELSLTLKLSVLYLAPDNIETQG